MRPDIHEIWKGVEDTLTHNDGSDPDLIEIPYHGETEFCAAIDYIILNCPYRTSQATAYVESLKQDILISQIDGFAQKLSSGDIHSAIIWMDEIVSGDEQTTDFIAAYLHPNYIQVFCVLGPQWNLKTFKNSSECIRILRDKSSLDATLMDTFDLSLAEAFMKASTN